MIQDQAAVQATQLEQGLQQLGISIDQTQFTLFLDYLQLLHKWNKTYNLTAVRNPQDHVVRHILDSLAVLPFITGTKFLDVGTGPGLPGIPLAIAMPESKWYLLDSNGKKTRFLTQCKMNLPLPNIEIVNSRLDQYRPQIGCRFDGITSRAFATLEAFVSDSRGLISPSANHIPATRLYALKGIFPESEVRNLPANWKIVKSVKLSVPGSEAERHLLILAEEAVV